MGHATSTSRETFSAAVAVACGVAAGLGAASVARTFRSATALRRARQVMHGEHAVLPLPEQRFVIGGRQGRDF